MGILDRFKKEGTSKKDVVAKKDSGAPAKLPMPGSVLGVSAKTLEVLEKAQNIGRQNTLLW